MADLTKIEGTVDIDCVDDLKPHMPSVSGRLALAQRLARRLTTPRGRLPFWPNFGTDLRQFLLSKTRSEQISAAAEDECVKDEQVESVTIQTEILRDGRELNLTIFVTDAEGPFRFTLEIADAKANLLALQAA